MCLYVGLDRLSAATQDARDAWKALTDEQRTEFNEKAKIEAKERRFIEDDVARMETLKEQEQFLQEYIRDFSAKFGMAAIFIASSVRPDRIGHCTVLSSDNAMLSVAELEDKRFLETMLLNSAKRFPFKDLDVKELGTIYRNVFKDLVLRCNEAHLLWLGDQY